MSEDNRKMIFLFRFQKYKSKKVTTDQFTDMKFIFTTENDEFFYSRLFKVMDGDGNDIQSVRFSSTDNDILLSFF